MFSDVTHFMMTPGRKSKLAFTILSSSCGDFLDVPYVKTEMDSGSAIPIAYES